ALPAPRVPGGTVPTAPGGTAPTARTVTGRATGAAGAATGWSPARPRRTTAPCPSPSPTPARSSRRAPSSARWRGRWPPASSATSRCACSRSSSPSSSRRCSAGGPRPPPRSRPERGRYRRAVHADRFAPLPPDVAERWAKFGSWDRTYFPSLVGLQLEEVRADYCRMRLPYRPELDQPHGVVHGGAIATLIDTVVVPAVGAAYEPRWEYATVTMDVQYLAAVVREDAVAEGWVVQRGRSLVFCRAEVTTASARLAATGSLTYRVRPPRG